MFGGWLFGLLFVFLRGLFGLYCGFDVCFVVDYLCLDFLVCVVLICVLFAFVIYCG